MKKTMIVAAMIAACVGCTSSTRIEWGGRTALRGPDGQIMTVDGAPVYESGKNIYKDSNWLTRREERDVEVVVNSDGSYSARLGSRVNDVSTNGIAMVTGSIEATTRLVSECAAAYVKIAGGAQGDAATAVVAKLLSMFAAKGGDAEKAAVTVDAGKVKVADGTVCVECDAAGNCAACNE